MSTIINDDVAGRLEELCECASSGGSKGKGGGPGGARSPPLKCLPLPPTAPPNEALAQFGMADIIIVYLLRAMFYFVFCAVALSFVTSLSDNVSTRNTLNVCISNDHTACLLAGPP